MREKEGTCRGDRQRGQKRRTEGTEETHRGDRRECIWREGEGGKRAGIQRGEGGKSRKVEEKEKNKKYKNKTRFLQKNYASSFFIIFVTYLYYSFKFLHLVSNDLSLVFISNNPSPSLCHKLFVFLYNHTFMKKILININKTILVINSENLIVFHKKKTLLTPYYECQLSCLSLY